MKLRKSFIFILSSLFLLSTLGVTATTRKKNVSDKIQSIPALRNPDRGFHTESNFILPEGINPFERQAQPPFSKETFQILNKKFQCEADSITLVQQYFYLTNYVNGDLDQVVLKSMEEVFDQLLEDDINAILRYAYNWRGRTCLPGENKPRILGHIHQVAPFLQAHVGQIATLQAGFFGAWGEWHTSDLWGNHAANGEIVSALLEALPAPCNVQVRYPYHEKPMLLKDESQRGRIGFNNDYFTAGLHPRAKNNDFVGEDYEHVLERVRTSNSYILAEIPYPGETAWNLNELIDTDTTLMILQEHRYSAFDITQNFDLNIQSWKNVKLTSSHLDSLGIRHDKRYFQDEKGREVVRSYYQFVRDHLGYRLNVKEGAKVKARGNKLKYDFTLTNSGFARPMFPGEAYLVLVKDNQICKKILLTDDIMQWLPMTIEDESVMAEYHFEGQETVDGLKGIYQVGIWIPKTNERVRYRAAQNIKIAPNNTVEHLWLDGKYAINVLGEMKF